MLFLIVMTPRALGESDADGRLRPRPELALSLIHISLRFLAFLALCGLAPFFLCAIRIFEPDKVYSLMTYRCV